MYNLNYQIDNYAKPAIQGQQGQKTAFTTCCRLWRNSLDVNEVRTALDYYNSTMCKPPFNEMELIKILTDSFDAVNAQNEIGKYRRKSVKTTPSKIVPKTVVKVPSVFTPCDTEELTDGHHDALMSCHNRLLNEGRIAVRMRAYLEGRGINSRSIDRFNLGVTGKHGQSFGGVYLAKWLTIPTYDIDGALCGVMTKTFCEVGYKKTGTGACLFVGGMLSADTVYIVEGHLDAILLSQFGATVATVGSERNRNIDAVGFEWLQSKQLVIIGDNDHAGKCHSMRWVNTFENSRYTPLTKAKDISDLWKLSGDDGIRGLLNPI